MVIIKHYGTAVCNVPVINKYGMCVFSYTLGLCSVLRPLQHSIGYMGDGFYRSKDQPTNSINVLKENLQRKTTQRKENNTHRYTK